MPETPTPNYALAKPEMSDLMSDFDTWLNENWAKIEDAVSPPSGTTLPQAGTYDIGDRFYKSDTKSIYILVCKDANWGWHWRPVQDAISPWLTVPATAINNAAWTINPVGANPLAIAMDNRGKCYWRGVIGAVAGTIPRATTHFPLKQLPDGIRPRQRGAYMCGHETLAVGNNGANFDSWQGARIFISDAAADLVSVRCFGGTAEFNRIHLGGSVQYAVGTGKYINP